MKAKAFLSYSNQDSKFVLQVASHLRRHFDCFVFEEAQKADQDYAQTLNSAIRESGVMVVFVGSHFSRWQVLEVDTLITLQANKKGNRKVVLVAIGGQLRISKLPKKLNAFVTGRPFLPDKYSTSEPPKVNACAEDIILAMNEKWVGADGLPNNPHLFGYEKDIINFFLEKEKVNISAPAANKSAQEATKMIRGMLLDGCPDCWPRVTRFSGEMEENKLLPKLPAEPYESAVVAAALQKLEASKHEFTFLEARPRKNLYFPQQHLNRALNVGILVSGGIAPGINAAIDAIVQRHWLYSRYQQTEVNIYGFQYGFWALSDFLKCTRLLRPDTSFTFGQAAPQLSSLETSEHATEGGSMLGTSREDLLKDPEARSQELARIAEVLNEHKIDILYVIGGDGSMRAAHALWNVAQTIPRSDGSKLSVVAIPKTMDNDILWAWQTFGFSSAVQKAREIVELMHTEVKSNPRLCVIQLYGSDSGFVVSHAVSASATGHCDLALIPEDDFTMLGIARHLKERICTTGRRIPYGLVVMAEAAIPLDALECIGERSPKSHQKLYEEINAAITLSPKERATIVEFDQLRSKNKRIEGQTDDLLRQASLRIVMQALPILVPKVDIPKPPPFIPNWARLRMVVNEPRNLLRTVVPSTSDLTMAQRLGVAAVDNALAGYTDFMISQWLTEYVLVPLKLVVLGRKRIPKSGMFWESVLAKTGQPAVLH
jgi:6-phosphofructokinase 1